MAYSFANTDMVRVGQWSNDIRIVPFIHTGFKPAFVMWKQITSGDGLWPGGGGITNGWYMYDTTRDQRNITKRRLSANLPDAEIVDVPYFINGGWEFSIDLLSNGFAWQDWHNPQVPPEKFIYLAIAEETFKHARGR